MFYKIIELQEISGSECTIYSVILKGDEDSLFDQFIWKNERLFENEVNEIAEKLYRIGHVHGARSQYFKFNEGKPGDHVCALYDYPDKNLRLFCLRIGMNILILGGGAFKAKDIKAWQDDPLLASAGNLMLNLAKHIGKRLETRDDLWLSNDQNEIEGDLINYDDEGDK